MSVALKAVACAWRFTQTENDSPLSYTQGVANLTRWKSKIVLSTGESQNLTCWKSKRVLSTRESRLPGVLGTWESRLPGVLCTGESRLWSTLWVKTPRCPMYRGVAKLDPLMIQNSPKYRGVKTPWCPMNRGVFFSFFEHLSPCCSL